MTPRLEKHFGECPTCGGVVFEKTGTAKRIKLAGLPTEEYESIRQLLSVPTTEEFATIAPVEHEVEIVRVKPGDRARQVVEMRGGASVWIIRIVKRQDFAWLEYQAFPETGTEICDHCGDEEPRPCREVRARHICFSCYLNEPVGVGGGRTP